MKVEHLRTFLTVYRLGTMRQAAQLLVMTQPAVSQHIQSLENFLGHPLFKRSRKGVIALASADDLAGAVAPHLDAISQALEARRGISEQLSGVVHIAMPSESAFYFTDALSSLAQTGITPQLQLGGKERLYDMLLNDEIDLALTASIPSHPKLDYSSVGQEQLVVIGHPSLKHPSERSPELKDLPQKAFAAYDTDLALIRAFMQAFEPNSHLPEAFIYCPDLRSIIRLCTQSPLWSVVPQHLAKKELQSQSVVSLSEKRLSNDFYLTWQRKALRSSRIAFAQRHLMSKLSHALSSN